MVLRNDVDPQLRGQSHSTALLSHMEAVLADFGITESKLESTATSLEVDRSIGWKDAGAPFEHFGMPGYPMCKPFAGPANKAAR